MVVLRKIVASTLMETLVATVLIVLVFMTASLVFYGLFAAGVRFKEHEVEQELLRLEYLHQNHLLTLPYYDNLGEWEVEVSITEWQGVEQVHFKASNESVEKEIIRKR